MLLKNSPIDIEGIYEEYINKKQEENRVKRAGIMQVVQGHVQGNCILNL